MKKKASTTKGLTKTEKNTVAPKVVKKVVKKESKPVSETSSIIQSLLGDIAFAVKNTDHSSIITALTKCHKDILNIKKDVGIAN
jgi:recombinational DNA repair protein RecT